MAEQELLTGPARPADGGLWARYITDGAINHAAWLRARAGGEFVGTCRWCAGYLVPQPPDDRGSGRFDYTAACRHTETCRYELVAPGGRVNRGSNLKSHRKGA